MKPVLVWPCLALMLVLGACQREPSATGGGDGGGDGAPSSGTAKADSVAWERYAPEPTAVQAAALYWSLHGGEPDYEQLGRLFIDDWPRDGDAFAKQDRLAAFKPGFEAELRAAPARQHFVYDTVGNLDHYVPATRAFPLRRGNLGMGNYSFAGTRPPSAESPELRFSNLDGWNGIVVVDETVARSIEAMVARNSTRLRLYLLAEGPAVDARGDAGALMGREQAMRIGLPKARLLAVRIMRIAVLDDDDRELAAALPTAP